MGGGGGVKSLEECRFPTIIIFWTGGKNSLDYLQKKHGNIGRYFAALLRYF